MITAELAKLKQSSSTKHFIPWKLSGSGVQKGRVLCVNEGVRKMQADCSVQIYLVLDLTSDWPPGT